MQTKIMLEHQMRLAYIYIRQSTMEQVRNNKESKLLQYRLIDRAHELGWNNPEVIDEDLGCSGSGTTFRSGFNRLLDAVKKGVVGAIFCFEASRLARNNREWYQLIDYCLVVNTLVIDLDGIYDPNNFSDRMLLGLKGTMSEYELGIFRQRAQAAIQAKAERGEFYTNLPAGYVLTEDRRCEMDPNQRIRDAFYLIFKKFDEFGSIAQTAAWFQEQKIEIPGKSSNGQIIWKLPTVSSLRKTLKNPIYAGAYVYGKSKTTKHLVDGQFRKSSIDLPIDQWQIFIENHHAGYISLVKFMAIQKSLEQNTSKRGELSKGAPKNGPALLVGLIRCQRCGQKLRVRYSQSNSGVARYVCKGQENNGKSENCINFFGTELERLVCREVLEVVEPASIAAVEQLEGIYFQQQKDQEQQLNNSLLQAEYDANRCFEQFNLADPKNRLVAQNLENLWNEALEKVEQIKKRLETLEQSQQPLTDRQRQALYRLANDLPEAWYHPRVDVRLKKRIIQGVIEAIWVDIDADNHLAVTIHWAGGVHTQHQIKRRKVGARPNYLHPDTEKIVRELSEIVSDQEIARILNLLKIQTASGKSWNAMRVRTFRHQYHIPIFDPAVYEAKGWVNLQQAADILATSPTAVSRLIMANIIKARQVVKYSPWIIEKDQLIRPDVINAVNRMKNGKKVTDSSSQFKMEL